MDDSPTKMLLLATKKAKIEHPFHVIKHLFDYQKVLCKGLANLVLELTEPVRLESGLVLPYS